MTKATRKKVSHHKANRQQPPVKTLLQGTIDPVSTPWGSPWQNHISPDVPHYIVPDAPVALWLGSKIASLLGRRHSGERAR